MKTYLKEVIISLAAILLMALAIIAYLKVVKNEQSNLETDLYTLIPTNASSLLTVNRPDIFNRMMLRVPMLHDVFATEIPEIFLTLIERDHQMPQIVFSFHPQGVLCGMQTGRATRSNIENLLKNMFKPYSPQKQTMYGIDFYYYPDTENRFFGYYFHQGVWVGSYSRKLLERAAGQQLNGKIVLPPEMRNLLSTLDTNSPANIIYPTLDLGLYGNNRQMDNRWLAGDLFASEGSFCCYSRMPYFDEEMRDSIMARIAQRYPSLQPSFQATSDNTAIFITACSPLSESN
jgi:hypothetical protein